LGVRGGLPEPDRRQTPDRNRFDTEERIQS
jgi:hypothetical protein